MSTRAIRGARLPPPPPAPEARPQPDTAPAEPSDFLQRWLGITGGEASSNPRRPLLDFLGTHEATRLTLEDFLKTRASWFQNAGKGGDFTPMAVTGIGLFQRMLSDGIATYSRILGSVQSPVLRCEPWQDPESLSELDTHFQFFAAYLPVISDLITAYQQQRTLVAGDETLRHAAPLTQVVLEEFFSAYAAARSENPVMAALAPDMMEKAEDHIRLLIRYDTVKAQYQTNLAGLKELTSPLVGMDVPWAGYYAPEYPAQTGRNPSTLPDVYLNNFPLQKAFIAGIGQPFEEECRALFKVLNRDPASPEQETAEMMASTTWDADRAWQHLEEITTQRASVVDSMQKLIAAAGPFKTADDTTIDKAIPELKAGIQQAKELLKEAGAALDRWYVPTIPEDIQRLKPVATQMKQAEDALDDAAVALRAGDQTRAYSQFTVALRTYVMAIETPHFKTLIADVEEYQKLSIYPKLAGMVVTIRFGAALGAMAAVGTRGALTRLLIGTSLTVASRTVAGVNIGEIAISGASLFANATTFAVTTSWMGHMTFGDPLPRGALGWSYELGSNTLLFGILGKMATTVAKRVKTIQKGLEKIILRAAVTPLRGEGFVVKGMNTITPPNRLLRWIPAATGEVLTLIPTYLFFAGLWTPLDTMGTDAVTTGTLPTQAKARAAFEQGYTLQSWGMQLGVLAALSVGKQGRLTQFLCEKLNAGLDRVVTRRMEAMEERRATLQQELVDLRSDNTGSTLARMARETAIRRDIAATLRDEHTIITLVMDNTPDVADYKAQLLRAHEQHDAAAGQLQSMAALLRVSEAARLRPIGSGIMSYAASARAALRGLCAHANDVFSMRDIGNDSFILKLNGAIGAPSEVTLVPEPTKPLSSSTDIVPSK